MSDHREKSDHDIAAGLERARKNVIALIERIDEEETGSRQDADALEILSRMAQELSRLREELVGGRWEGRRLLGFPPPER